MASPRFGYCLPIFASPGAALFRTPGYEALDPKRTLELGVLADALGYDSLWVADHLMLGKDEAILEGWTTLSVLAGATKQARLGMIHMANLFRHPSLVAKMVATLDQLSGGRVIHFPDFGHNAREHVAYGLPWIADTDERARRFLDALNLTLQLWTQSQVSYSGELEYGVEGAVCEPAVVQKPHPPVWLGETNQHLLDWCAEHGQGWNTVPASIGGLREKLGALRRACDQKGRPFDDIEKSLEIQILIATNRDALRHRLRDIVDLAPDGEKLDPNLAAYLAGETDDLPKNVAETWLAGTPDEVATRIDAYAAEGISHFMLWFVDAPDDAGLRLFASDVLPRYRQS